MVTREGILLLILVSLFDGVVSWSSMSKVSFSGHLLSRSQKLDKRATYAGTTTPMFFQPGKMVGDGVVAGAHIRVYSHILHMTASSAAVKDESGAGSILTLFSPAKTNIFLRITRKRDDGFHELASVFQALGLGDTLDFSVMDKRASQDELRCNVPEVPLDERNLVSKAFSIFRKKSGIQTFFRCNIEKRTPLEGGMGGGSSNAATALWAANKMCGSPATDEQLIEWGAELGRCIYSFIVPVCQTFGSRLVLVMHLAAGARAWPGRGMLSLLLVTKHMGGMLCAAMWASSSPREPPTALVGAKL